MHTFRCTITNYLFPIIWHPSLIIPQNTLLWYNKTNKIKSYEICQYQFSLFSKLIPLKITRKGPKLISPQSWSPHYLQTEKLTLITSMFNILINIVVTHLFMPTIFSFLYDRTYDSTIIALFSIFSFFYLHVLKVPILLFLSL